VSEAAVRQASAPCSEAGLNGSVDSLTFGGGMSNALRTIVRSLSKSLPRVGVCCRRATRVILRQKRDGFPGDRLLVNVRLAQFAAFLRAYPPGDPGLEHVFDY
jgi:hypothetical protein